MLIAIDIDGTLTAWPLVFERFFWSLSDEHLGENLDIVLLTGHACPEPIAADRDALLQGRIGQLNSIGTKAPLVNEVSGPIRSRNIRVCVGKNSGEVALLKAEFCRDRAVDIFIDDSTSYCLAVRKLSPKTLVLQVHQ